MRLQARDVGGRLRTTLEIQLGEDRADVVLDRLVGQEDVARDLFVRLSAGDGGNRVEFANAIDWAMDSTVLNIDASSQFGNNVFLNPNHTLNVNSETDVGVTSAITIRSTSA